MYTRMSIGGKRVRFYSDVFIETFCLYFHFATTSFKYTQNLQILHHHCARAIRAAGCRRDVGSEKITPVRILGEYEFSRGSLVFLPRVFPIRRISVPSFPRFLRPFFIILTRPTEWASEQVRARTVMRKNERKRRRVAWWGRARERGREDIPVSSKRFEPQYLPAMYRRGL